MTARVVGGRDEMCEWKASSDLMSVMVDMMRIVALWEKVERGEVKRAGVLRGNVANTRLHGA